MRWYICVSFFFKGSCDHRDLHVLTHSFPTRRSSDLAVALVEFHIAVLPGDGIGPEVVTPSLDVLAAACLAVGGLKLHFTTMEAGALVYRERGVDRKSTRLNSSH